MKILKEMKEFCVEYGFVFWHYLKVTIYWVLLLGGVYASWWFIHQLMEFISNDGCLGSPLFVFSLVCFLANIVLLFVWGIFIKELILVEYNYYHKRKEKNTKKNKKTKKAIKRMKKCIQDIQKDINSVKDDVAKLKH